MVENEHFASAAGRVFELDFCPLMKRGLFYVACALEDTAAAAVVAADVVGVRSF